MIEVEKKVYGTVTRYFIKGTQTLHREDGPAIIRRDGKMQWYLNDQHYTREEWFEALTEEKKVKALYSEYFMGE